MTIEEKIAHAASVLARSARSPAKVILFGSHVRGDAVRGSDVDFLVVERDVDSSFDEAVRLRSQLRGLRLPIDVIVVSEREAEAWRGVKNSLIDAALREGRIVAQTQSE